MASTSCLHQFSSVSCFGCSRSSLISSISSPISHRIIQNQKHFRVLCFLPKSSNSQTFFQRSGFDQAENFCSAIHENVTPNAMHSKPTKQKFKVYASSDLPSNERNDSSREPNENSQTNASETRHEDENGSNAFARSMKNWIESNISTINSEFGVNVSKTIDDLISVWYNTLAMLNAIKISVRNTPNRIQAWSEKAKPSLKEFLDWNSFSLWKDIKKWDSVRMGVAFLYLFFVFSFSKTVYKTSFSPYRPSAITASSETFMDLTVPEPTPKNIIKMKKAIWRSNKPEWLSVKRYVADPETGIYKEDENYVGDKAWKEEKEEEEEEREGTEGTENGTGTALTLSKENTVTVKRPWRERLGAWAFAMEEEMNKEKFMAPLSKYEVQIDWDKVKQEFEVKGRKELEERMLRERWCSFWVEKNWWKFRPSLPYTWLLSAIQNHEIESAVYSEDLRRVYVTVKEGFPDEFVVDIPVDPHLFESFRHNGVQLGMARRNPFFFLRGILILAPSLLILSFIANFQLNLQTSMKDKVRDLMLMKRDKLIMPNDPELATMTTYNDVVMGEGVWSVVNEMMNYMQNPMKYLSQGAKLPRGVLISGPPGTGKTLLARAIARESGLPFVYASGAEFIQSNKGEGKLSVYDIFYTARSMAPSFIFIDEVDALAGKSVVEDPARREIFDQFIKELDGEPEDTDVDRFSMRQAVILLAATNRPDDLHAEFLKPGRIDREVYIGAPEEAERVKIFKVHSKDRTMAADVDFSKLAFRTTGFTGADIRNLINEAGIIAVRKGRAEIRQEDVAEALDKQLFEGLGISQTDEEEKSFLKNVPFENKKLLAVHEAGHILLAHLFPKFDLHAFSHILPGGKEKGLSVFYPREEMLQKGHASIGYLRMQMVVSHGGRCAEKLIYGLQELTEAGTDDLNYISKLAREIACSPANARMGLMPMTFHEVMESPAKAEVTNLIPNKWSKRGTQIANFSKPLSELFTREVTTHVDETEAIAMEALLQNKHILLYLIDHLIEKFKIRGMEADSLVKSMNPIMLPDFLDDSQEDEIEENVQVELDPERAGRYEFLNVYPAPLHRS